ncbi:ribosome small subunit-dependent GTPase A [Nocardioides mesophilus]|uniref:Small ribosomal subunit biogenesis GTPase RsgA n=1 Tax=Nocardioides mesophilus TaxID=433659 RepID=A0A7G9RHS3_9ACTN|nr:ribosome small subunit-dependent GTPase A [Nocardioides mesophilus]QNN55148.1 ribosome small subunit-dependent GTPase A [Nocardioides mesophilus]
MIGYDAATAASYAPWDATDASVGRVVRVDRGVASVLAEDGLHRASWGGAVLARAARDPEQAPCAGDWCVLRSWPDHRVTLEHLLPRRTSVTRATAGKQSAAQVICANVDMVGLVVALHPLPAETKIERLLALAWQSGAEPVVLLTKADLVSDAAEVAADVRRIAPEVEVLPLSVVTGEGLERLRARVDGHRTLALVGTSGHGKSSLTNALVGAEVLRTREIRDDGRGRHTSVRRELVPLPGGGAVIDTPGLRSVGLLAADSGLRRTFADVEELAARCRFDDCAHGDEPGCAVVAALADGTLSVRRWESWRRLQRESASGAARQDARVRAATARQQRSRRGRSRPDPDRRSQDRNL